MQEADRAGQSRLADAAGSSFVRPARVLMLLTARLMVQMILTPCPTVEILFDASLTVKLDLPDLGHMPASLHGERRHPSKEGGTRHHQRGERRHPHQGFRTKHKELMLFALIAACRSCHEERANINLRSRVPI